MSTPSQVPDFFPASDETPDFIPLTPDTLADHAQSSVRDPMAAANVRMAIANVPRPASPIPSEPNILPMAGQAVSDVFQNAGQSALGAGRSLFDATPLGAAWLAQKRGFGLPVTPQQLEAHARLQAAGKNAVINYAMLGESKFNLLKNKPNFTGNLLNATADITPETLANIETAKPALEAGGAPLDKTQAGMATHTELLSRQIQNQIAPVIQNNAAKDVTASSAQIASDIRSQITPQMKRTNPGVASTLDRFAKLADDTKTLEDLDGFRKQLELRRDALKPGSIASPYVRGTLNSVLDAIAGHVEEIRPDLQVRSLRTQQKALMQLSDVFEASGAKGRTLEASRAAMPAGQRLGQSALNALEWIKNPKTAGIRNLMKPATAEEFIKRAYAAQPRSAAGQLVRSVQAPMSDLEMDQITRRPPPGTDPEAIKQALQQAAEKARGNQYGGTPEASVSDIMNTVRQQRPELFPGQASPLNPEQRAAELAQWGPEYQGTPQTLGSEGGAGANFTAEDLAALKKRLGIP